MRYFKPKRSWWFLTIRGTNQKKISWVCFQPGSSSSPLALLAATCSRIGPKSQPLSEALVAKTLRLGDHLQQQQQQQPTLRDNPVTFQEFTEVRIQQQQKKNTLGFERPSSICGCYCSRLGDLTSFSRFFSLSNLRRSLKRSITTIYLLRCHKTSLNVALLYLKTTQFLPFITTPKKWIFLSWILGSSMARLLEKIALNYAHHVKKELEISCFQFLWSSNQLSSEPSFSRRSEGEVNNS